MMNTNNDLVSQIAFDSKGLVPVIAQDYQTNEVLMLAWMNKESLLQTLEKQEMVYFSRSRNKLWHKGEQSGHFQRVKSIAFDCDGDALLAKVEQIGDIACHTGRKTCFYQSFAESGVIETHPILKSSKEIYGSGHE